MPLVLADRVKETTTTAGTGTIVLGGAATGFQSFSVIGNANTTYYTISSNGGADWEVGIGTYTSSNTTLSRDTVLASSAGAPTKTNFAAGTKDVFVTYAAGRSVYEDISGSAAQFAIWESATTISGNCVISSRGMSLGPITINTSASVTAPTNGSWLIVD
jgi:hypothetical protein